MALRKISRRFHHAYGQTPDVEYFAGDMQCIRSFFNACRAQERDAFYIDETTWNDLDMDAVYKRINPGLSTAGEQYLYYMLRRPMNRAQFDRQNALTQAMAQEADTRLKLQKILRRLGCYRAIDIGGVLHGRKGSSLWLIVYLLLALFVPVALVLAVTYGTPGLYALFGGLAVNAAVHEFRLQRCDREIKTVNYCVGLAFALRKIKGMKHAGLDALLEDSYAHLHRMRSLLHIGPVISASQNDIVGALMTVFLLDLITFELLKSRLAKYCDDFSVIHEAVGQVDAAIAIASFRESIEDWSAPQIDFDAKKGFLHAKGVVHPLLAHPVANDALLDRPLLITGANASGKSTYLKATMLCALLAQTIGTATCKRYHASPFRLYTSMALTDHLQEGESYYIAEIKSLKRILDDPCKDMPVLCAIDEVLRGTNTIERIAASTEVLRALERSGALCLVATHDAELCSLVGDAYALAHFEEAVTEKEILFDYRIRPGAATTRNAINLLKLMGFDENIVDAAHRRASFYVQTGQWHTPDE